MHIIQEKILKLSKKQNLAKLSFREIAKQIGDTNASPQKIKHHLMQLQKRGFLRLDKVREFMNRSESAPRLAKGLLEKSSHLFSIPIIGTANCGVATIFAEENFQGFLKVSSKLIQKKSPKGLYAIKADGLSMNKAEINNKKIDDGDLVIIDSLNKNIKTGDIVLAIIDNKATIKRFIDDRVNGQIALKADSSFDYEPIYLHPDDNFFINGKVVDVIKRP